MKTLVLALCTAGVLSGCVAYPYDPYGNVYYQEGYPYATGYSPHVYYGGYYQHYSPRYYPRHPHHYGGARDRDRDGVPDMHDRRPYNRRHR